MEKQAAGPWIPVTERLPSVDEYVLLWDAHGGACFGYRDGYIFVGGAGLDGDYLTNVTHWAEIREP